MSDPAPTLYSLANAAIRESIKAYLELMEASHGLSVLNAEHLDHDLKTTIVLAGLGVRAEAMSAAQTVEEWRRRQAVPFDIEAGITHSVYLIIRRTGATFLDELERETNGFRTFSAEFIHSRPYLLPVLQHLAGVFSKAALKKAVGGVSDRGFSKPAAQRLAALLTERVQPDHVNKGEILKRLESTLEGIVRDLIGRVLLESIVDSALRKRGVPFQREEEYTSLAGVIYDFRADFVLPNAESPMAFIEVRKSSSRHASLYAKDKMFSAINWKGRHGELLAILVVDGEWTRETLRVMAKVFDYVVPINRVPELVETVTSYLQGDKSKLKWLIQFRITSAT